MSDLDDDDEYERRLAALFAACDAHQDGAVDQEERFGAVRAVRSTFKENDGTSPCL